MQVLSRKDGETVVINPGSPDQVVIHVHNRRGSRVQLGIEAPGSVRVVRGETVRPPEMSA